MTIPIAPIAGVLASKGTQYTVKSALEGNFPQAFAETGRFAGLDPSSGQFSWGILSETYTPILAGLVVHKIAGKVGLNAMLGKAKIPYLRV